MTEEDARALTGHSQSVLKNANLIHDYLKPLWEKHYISSEQVNFTDSKDDAINLKTFAAKLADLIIKKDKIANIEPVFNQVNTIVQNINTTYLKDSWINQNNYKPMKEIQNSLAYIKSYIDKQKQIDAQKPPVSDVNSPTPP